MSEFYFSAAATKASREKGKLVKYRAYIKGKYFDRVSERYDFVNILELQTLHIPLDMPKIEYYREHPDEPILTASASENGQIVRLSREPYYSVRGNHTILPLQLTCKRFRFASNSDLELWQEESQEEDNIVFVGAISGVTPTREILQMTGEDLLLHEAYSTRDAQIREMTDSNGSFLNTTDPSFNYDYQENFSVIEKPCNRWDCPLCNGGLIQLEKPTWFIVGLPSDHKDVVGLRFKKAKEKKLKDLTKLAKLAELSTILSRLTSDSSMELDESPSLDSYYSELQ